MNFKNSNLIGRALAVMAAAIVSLSFAGAAQAGCGCDHPPPNWAPIMPSFASPGKMLTISPAGNEQFYRGSAYHVIFEGTDGLERLVYGTATSTTRVEVEMPSGLRAGPVDIRVSGPGYDEKYDDEYFTAMPAAAVIPPREAVYLKSFWGLPVDRSGTLLIPIDVSQIVDPAQFAFMINNLAIAFGHDDVVIYNADGVDLTLFTLEVQDPTEREWGSYFGWDVNGDGGLNGTAFENTVLDSLGESGGSDILSYWRHEFHTYAEAHKPGGSHEVDENG